MPPMRDMMPTGATFNGGLPRYEVSPVDKVVRDTPTLASNEECYTHGCHSRWWHRRWIQPKVDEATSMCGQPHTRPDASAQDPSATGWEMKRRVARIRKEGVGRGRLVQSAREIHLASIYPHSQIKLNLAKMLLLIV